MMRAAKYVLAVFTLLVPQAVKAQCVQLAPDVCVTAKSYEGPINEQPFFGFAAKTPAMIAADDAFVIESVKIGKDKALIATLIRAEEAMARKDFAIAARRFNQAYLLEKRDSRVYHGFALIVLQRFKDLAYAEELFKVAKRLPNALPSLNGDYGHLLMNARRAVEARPLLEDAAKQTPSSPVVWTDLAFARLLTDDRPGACDAAAQALRLSPPDTIANGLNFLRSKLECK